MEGPHDCRAPSQFTGPSWQRPFGRCCPLLPLQSPRETVDASQAGSRPSTQNYAQLRSPEVSTRWPSLQHSHHHREENQSDLLASPSALSSSFLLLEDAASRGPGLQSTTPVTATPPPRHSHIHLPPPFRGLYNFNPPVPTPHGPRPVKSQLPFLHSSYVNG